jgi:3D (Asp-Asp-Asp) domain-containing protein
MSELDGANRGREWRQADRFLADLLGSALPRPRRGSAVAGAPPRPPSSPPVAPRPRSSPPIASAPPSVPMALPPDSAGRLFDRIVHGVGTAFAGEALDAAFKPVALPGSLTPPHELRPGDLVAQRALGEGRLGCLRVLGENAAIAELYDPAGRIRRDTLVLRGPAGEARARTEDVPGDVPGNDDAPAPPAAGDADSPAGSAAALLAPSLASARGKLYRVATAQGGVTAVYVPEAAHATDPVALLVWIHGDLLCGDEGLDAVALVKGRTFPLVQQLSDSRRPCVLVVPSMGWHCQSSHALGEPKAMNTFLDEVRRGLTNAGWTSAPGFGRLILAGHARASAVLGSLAAGVRDAEWSRGALATVSDVWLIDPTCATTQPQRECDSWTAFANARANVRLRIFHRRQSSTAPMAECIRDAAAAAGLGNVTVVDSNPTALAHCEMPRAHVPGLLGGLTAAGAVPVVTGRGAPTPSVPVASDRGASAAPAVAATAFRRWYITPYHMAAEPDASGEPRVPVLTLGGEVIAEVPAGLFAEMALTGRGRLRDGRLLTGDGWRSPAGHDYTAVLAVHLRRYPENHKYHDQTRVSGISLVDGDVKTVRAYAVVPAAKAGVGYGVLRGISLEPFKTLAADIGGFESSDPRYRGRWSDSLKRYVVVNGKTGLVPTGTRVYVRQLDGGLLPNGERHDGWLVVNDTSSRIHGAHFDVFVGEKRYGEPLMALTGGRFVDVWFDGIEARVPAGYDYGLPVGRTRRRSGRESGGLRDQSSRTGHPESTGDSTVEQAPAGPPMRLRLSLFDMNPSFATGKRFSGGKVVGVNMDTALLDQFRDARIDDYSIVNTIVFGGASSNDDANPPSWSFLPLGDSNLRVPYLQQLCTEMHNRNAQVLVGYALVERGSTANPANAPFLAWLRNASAAQVTQHAQDIVDFFTKNGIDIDGIGFDFEVNGLGSAHGANLKTLFSATAAALDAYKKAGGTSVYSKGTIVYYDTGPFQPNDGQGSTANLVVLNYAMANAATNVIARPMCYNGSVTPTLTIRDSIDCALRALSSGGGGITGAHLQMAIDVSRTSDADVTSMCSTIFRPKGVGMTIYTMPLGRAAQSRLLTRAKDFEAALNTGASAPGTSRQPMQIPAP